MERMNFFQTVKSVLRQRKGIRRNLRNQFLDLRFGGRFLFGSVESEFRHLAYWETGNTDYDVLRELFGRISLRAEDVIVDVGCGKGRVMNFLLSQGVQQKIIGVEINPKVAEFTRNRLRRYGQISILTGDIRDSFPETGTVFYLYNPFGEDTVDYVASRLEKIRNKDRPLILYHNATHLEPFTKRGWKVERVDVSAYSLAPAAILRLE